MRWVVCRANIYIDDTPGIKITEIRAKCRKLAQEKGNLNFDRLLQLIEGTGKENRQQEVSDISRQLKISERIKSPGYRFVTAFSWRGTTSR